MSNVKKTGKFSDFIILFISMLIIISFAILIPLLILLGFFNIWSYLPGITISTVSIMDKILFIIKFFGIGFAILAIAETLSNELLKKTNIYSKLNKYLITIILNMVYIIIYVKLSSEIQANLLGITLLVISLFLLEMLFNFLISKAKRLDKKLSQISKNIRRKQKQNIKKK